ncbi:MAG: hypothetical protein ABI629_06940 [bacterium]
MQAMLLVAALCVGCRTRQPISPTGEPRYLVTIYDLQGEAIGQLDMIVTNQPAQSCNAADQGKLRLVQIVSQRLQPPLHLGSAPGGWLDDGKLLVDLSAPMCDAYLLLTGRLTASGASGDVVRSSIGSGGRIGTFQATLK